MKKIKLSHSRIVLPVILLFVHFYSFVSFGQKFGYIDSEYITSKMPEYSKVLTDIEDWQKRFLTEIQEKNNEIVNLDKKLRAEEIFLTDDLKLKRKEEISKKEKELADYNAKIFGYEGLLFQKKKELLKTIQDKVYKAVEKVARMKGLQFIFDKASEAMPIVYTEPRHDYTDYVIEELGLIEEEPVKNQKSTNK